MTVGTCVLPARLGVCVSDAQLRGSSSLGVTGGHILYLICEDILLDTLSPGDKPIAGTQTLDAYAFIKTCCTK